MSLFPKFAFPLALAVFFVAGTGCMEEEEKARDRGRNINRALHKNIDRAKIITGAANKPLEDLEKNLNEAEAEEE